MQKKQNWGCIECGESRIWGIGENETPLEYKPLLNCNTCHKQTRHVFRAYSLARFPVYMSPERIDTIKFSGSTNYSRPKTFLADRQAEMLVRCSVN